MRGAPLSNRARREPQAARLVRYVHEEIFATSAKVAKHFKLVERNVDALLRQRARTVGDVVKAGDFWQARTPPERDSLRRAGVITRPFRAWDGKLSGAPLRPGSMDYLAIPSLMGGERFDHLTGERLSLRRAGVR